MFKYKDLCTYPDFRVAELTITKNTPVGTVGDTLVTYAYGASTYLTAQLQVTTTVQGEITTYTVTGCVFTLYSGIGAIILTYTSLTVQTLIEAMLESERILSSVIIEKAVSRISFLEAHFKDMMAYINDNKQT